MTGTHPSVEGHVRARRAGPGRVIRLLAAGSALSMLSLSVAVTGAGASSDITTVAQLQSALCTDGGATVALTGDIDERSEDNFFPGSILTIGTSTTTCTATLDLNSRELRLERIVISAGSILTIGDSSVDADGELHAAPVRNEAGIQTTAATLVITGGKISASGGSAWGAGIGGRLNGDGGTVEITGGVVVATGGGGAAGIGGGQSGAGGDVSISGGDVDATGGSSAAGIGGGLNGAGGGVTISGGEVTATGGPGGAGIGGGSGGVGGTTTITDGDVTATTQGHGGAAIGGGTDGSGGTTTISGGTVVAGGMFVEAGIGGGRNGDGGTTLIEGGSVTATGGRGAGIGGGDGGGAGSITITGGVVEATGGSRSAGIGGGGNFNGTPGVGGQVEISGGSVTAKAFVAPDGSVVVAIGPGLGGSDIEVVVAAGATDETVTTFSDQTRTITFPPPPPPPAALSLVTQPSGAVVGAPLGVQPVVGLVDAAGVAVVQSGVEVSVAVASGPGSLDGVTWVETGSDGLAVFSGLSIDAEGEHTLVFTADGLEPVTSGTVLVGGGAVSDHPGVTVQVDASPLLVSVADSVVAFTVTAGTVLDGGPDGVDGAARRETAVTFDNPVGSASGSARVEVAFAAVPSVLSATSVGSVPDRELELHLWVEPPATAAFDTAPVSWDDEADGAQVLVSGIGQGVGLQSGLTMWWGLSGQTGAGTGGVPVEVGTVTFTITDDDG